MLKLESCFPEPVNCIYTVQDVLRKFYDIATDESDGENLELDGNGEGFNQLSA